MKTEAWLPVVGYESLYEVSDLGQVRSLGRCVLKANGVAEKRRAGMLRPRLAGKGYLYVTLYANGVRNQVAVHRLVARAFIGPDHGLHVNHIDLDKANNRVENLEWVTRSGNAQHALRAGCYRRIHSDVRSLARNNPRKAKKLTSAQVEEIKSLARAGALRQKDIASMFGITQAVVSKIHLGLIWRPKVVHLHDLAVPA